MQDLVNSIKILHDECTNKFRQIIAGAINSSSNLNTIDKNRYINQETLSGAVGSTQRVISSKNETPQGLAQQNVGLIPPLEGLLGQPRLPYLGSDIMNRIFKKDYRNELKRFTGRYIGKYEDGTPIHLEISDYVFHIREAGFFDINRNIDGVFEPKLLMKTHHSSLDGYVPNLGYKIGLGPADNIQKKSLCSDPENLFTFNNVPSSKAAYNVTCLRQSTDNEDIKTDYNQTQTQTYTSNGTIVFGGQIGDSWLRDDGAIVNDKTSVDYRDVRVIQKDGDDLNITVYKNCTRNGFYPFNSWTPTHVWSYKLKRMSNL